MLYVKPVPDVDIPFTFVTVYLSVFSLSFSYCLPVSGEIKLYIQLVRRNEITVDERQYILNRNVNT